MSEIQFDRHWLEWVDQAIVMSITQFRKEEKKRIKFGIGLLRQWLNERLSDELITNKDLELFLLPKLK
jgi:hypothetical protein